MARNLNELKQERIVKGYSHYFNKELDYICNKYLEDDEDEEDDYVVDLSSMDFTESSRGSINEYGAHIDRLKKYKAAGRDYKGDGIYQQPQREVEEEEEWQSGEEDESILQDLKKYMEQEASEGETISTASSTSGHSDIFAYKDIISNESTSSSDEDYLEEDANREENGHEETKTKHSPTNETYTVSDHSKQSAAQPKPNRAFVKDSGQAEQSPRPRENIFRRGRSNIKRDLVNFIDKMKPNRKANSSLGDSHTNTKKSTVKDRNSPQDKRMTPKQQNREMETDQMIQNKQRKSRDRDKDKFDSIYVHSPERISDKRVTPKQQNKGDQQRQSRGRVKNNFGANYRHSPPDNQIIQDQFHSQKEQRRNTHEIQENRKETYYRDPSADNHSTANPKHQNREIQTDSIAQVKGRQSRARTRDNFVTQSSPGLQYKDIPQNQFHLSNSSHGSLKQMNEYEREKTLHITRENTLRETRETTLQKTREVIVQTDIGQNDDDHILYPISPYKKYYRLEQKSPKHRSRSAQNNHDSWINIRFDTDNHDLTRGDDLSPSIGRHARKVDHVIPKNSNISSVESMKVQSAYAKHRHFELTYAQPKVSQTRDEGPEKGPRHQDQMMSPQDQTRDKIRNVDEGIEFLSPDKEKQSHDSMLEKSSKKDSGINSFIDDSHFTEVDCRRLSVKNLKAFNDSLTENIDIDVSMNQSDLMQVVENENANKIKKWLKTFPVEEDDDVIMKENVIEHEKSLPTKPQSTKTTPRGKNRSRKTSGPVEKSNASCQTETRTGNLQSPEQSPFLKATEHFPIQPKSSKRVFIKVARSEKKDKHTRKLSKDIGEMMRNVYSSPQRRRLIEQGLKSLGSVGKMKKRSIDQMEYIDDICDGNYAPDSVPTPPKSRKTSLESRLSFGFNSSRLGRSDLRNSQNSQTFSKNNPSNDSSIQNASKEQFYNDTVNYINSKTSPEKRRAYNDSLNLGHSSSPRQMYENSPRQQSRTPQKPRYIHPESFDNNQSMKSSRNLNQYDHIEVQAKRDRDRNRYREEAHDNQGFQTAHIYEQFEKPDYYESNEDMSDLPLEYRHMESDDTNHNNPNSNKSNSFEARNAQYRQFPYAESLMEMNDRRFPVNQSYKASVQRTVSNDLSQYEADLESNCETPRPEQNNSFSKNRLQSFVNSMNSPYRPEPQNQRYSLNNSRESQNQRESHNHSRDGYVVNERQRFSSKGANSNMGDVNERFLSKSVEEINRVSPRQVSRRGKQKNRSLENHSYNNNSVEYGNVDMSRHTRKSPSFDTSNYHNQSQNSSSHRIYGDISDSKNKSQSSYSFGNETGPKYDNFSPRYTGIDSALSGDQFHSPDFQRYNNTQRNFDPFSPSGSLAKLHLKASKSPRKHDKMSPRQSVQRQPNTTREDVDENGHQMQRHRSVPTNRQDRSYHNSSLLDESNKVLSAYEYHKHLEPSCSQPSNYESNTNPHDIQDHSDRYDITENQSYDNIENNRTHQMRRQNSGYSLREQSVYENISDKENEYRENEYRNQQRHIDYDRETHESGAVNRMNSRMNTSESYMQSEPSPYKHNDSYRQEHRYRDSDDYNPDRNTSKSGRNIMSPRYKEVDCEIVGVVSPAPRNVRQSPYRRSQSQSFDSAYEGRHSLSSYDILESRANSSGKVNENSFVRAKKAENNESNVAHIRKMEVKAKCSPKPKMKKSLFTGTRNVATPVSFTDFAQGISNSGTCEKKSVSPRNSKNSQADFKMPFSVKGQQNSAVKTSVKMALPKRPFQPQASYKDSTSSSVASGRGRSSAGNRGRGQNFVHSTPMRSKTAFLLNETLSTIQAPDETENEDDVILLNN